MLTLVAISVCGQGNKSTSLPKYDEHKTSVPQSAFSDRGKQSPAPQENRAEAESPPWYTSAEWWLFILGVPTLGALLWQANATKDAASAAQEGAEAALLNAQAVINVERPWFAPTMERYQDEAHGTLYRVRITNKGRTPGYLYEINSAKLFAEDPYKLPIPPNYNAPCYAPDTLFFATDDSFTDRERIPGYSPDFILQERASERGQFDFLVLYGRVTYVDLIAKDRVHETRWCYVWNEYRGFMPCGPVEYNGHHTYQQPNPDKSPD